MPIEYILTKKNVFTHSLSTCALQERSLTSSEENFRTKEEEEEEEAEDQVMVADAASNTRREEAMAERLVASIS